MTKARIKRPRLQISSPAKKFLYWILYHSPSSECTNNLASNNNEKLKTETKARMSKLNRNMKLKVFYTSDWLSNSKVLELSLEFLCFIHWLEEVVCVWIFVANIPQFLTNQTKGSRRNRMGPGELYSQFRNKEMKSRRVRYGWGMWGKKFC